MNNLAQRVLDKVSGKTIASVHNEALYGDGSGPLSVLIHFTDGTTLSFITEIVHFSDDTGNDMWQSQESAKIMAQIIADSNR